MNILIPNDPAFDTLSYHGVTLQRYAPNDGQTPQQADGVIFLGVQAASSAKA
ncbi:hypothetical protein [Deinococcus radiophilus]|uniref:hypothetical protein n=1 Tax=Deinococcus radiophilus TaxID=32062 RepID=UPI0036068AD2